MPWGEYGYVTEGYRGASVEEGRHKRKPKYVVNPDTMRAEKIRR